MKKSYIFLAIALIAAVGGYLLLNNKQAPKSAVSSEKPQMKDEASMKNEKAEMMGTGYIMKSDTMMVEENGKFSPMTQNATLKDGSVVKTTGEVTKKDGSKFTLTEGQSIWSDGTFMKAEEKMPEENSMNSVSSALSARYVDYSPENFTKATAGNGKAVLFFAALSWCPSCQAADRDFKAHFDKVPSDVTILKVDYDHDSAMKQKYAITIQDTFVQADNQGKEITRWNSGGQGIDALLANIK